jgi:hypothetical protein
VPDPRRTRRRRPAMREKLIAAEVVLLADGSVLGG